MDVSINITLKEKCLSLQKLLQTQKKQISENSLNIPEVQKETKKKNNILNDLIEEFESYEVKATKIHNETNHVAESSPDENIEDLEEEYRIKRVELESLLQGERQDDENDDSLNSECEQLMEHEIMLKETINELVENAQKMQENLNAIIQENNELKNKTQTLRTEVQETEEKCNIRRKSIHELNELKDTLEDEIMSMKNSLDLPDCDSVKTEQADSLFSEVDVKRMELQSKMKDMRSKYLYMKNERDGLLMQVKNLQVLNKSIKASWDEEILHKKNSMQSQLTKQRMLITSLTFIYDEYIKLRDVKYDINESPKLLMEKFYKIVEVVDKEIIQVKNQIDIELHHYSLTARSFDRERLDLKRLNMQIEEQKKEIKKLQMKDHNTKTKKGISKPENGINQFLKKEPVSTAPVAIDLDQFLASYAQKTEQPSLKDKASSEATASSASQKGNNSSDVIRCNNNEGYQYPDVLNSSPLKMFDLLNAKEEAAVDSKSQKVKFAPTTVFKDRENIRKYRRHGQLITCPVTYVPSLNKKE